ncbi:sigma-54-dependent Fis family transcriptional regulator [Porticoccus sp.]|uniref:sigma-54-dependent Fis family transcriptional regulator n=1 Tax=Porticoccus sp. TaxID=2024853 RepID=UPI003F697E50
MSANDSLKKESKPQKKGRKLYKGELTVDALRDENDAFRGTGGISEENRTMGFKPAFYDMETATIHASKFTNGGEAPMHVLDGLPADLIVSRQQNGKVNSVKPGVIAGFVQRDRFYTREQAALTTAQMRDRTQMLSDPEQHNQLLSVWEKFVVDQSYPSDFIRPVVEDSWRRCQQSHIDPELQHAPLIADDSLLEYRRFLQTDLMRAAQPIMKRASEVLFRSDSLILLADSEGLILDIHADDNVLSHATHINLIQGGVWDEKTAGTNAIGTALATAEPVQLYGAEHFCSGIKHWTCSADVIRDPHDGRVLGAVDLSGLTDSYQRNALDFAIMAARLIESNLAKEYLKSRNNVVEATKTMFLGWKTEGLLAFDRRGRLVKANQQAHNTLKILGADLVLTPQCRLPGLDLEMPGAPANAPSWLLDQLRLPIELKGQTVGTLIVLSAQHK